MDISEEAGEWVILFGQKKFIPLIPAIIIISVYQAAMSGDSLKRR